MLRPTLLIAICVATLALIVSASQFDKPRRTSIGALYAYGSGIDGLPVTFGSKTAFVGFGTPEGIVNRRNITFHMPLPTSKILRIKSATPPKFRVKDYYLYIDTTAGDFEPAGFITGSKRPSAPSTIATDGFVLYGSTLLWENAVGKLESLWWATPTTEDDTYTLGWNNPNVGANRAVPVIIRTTPSSF